MRPIHSAVMSEINTELSPIGIASADIVMSEGSPGEGSVTCEANLEKHRPIHKATARAGHAGFVAGAGGQRWQTGNAWCAASFSLTGENHGHYIEFHQQVE